jgi:lysophospholipase L1-like esterase
LQPVPFMNKRNKVFTFFAAIIVVAVCGVIVVAVDASFNVFGFVQKYRINQELQAFEKRIANTLDRIPDFEKVDKEAYIKEVRRVAQMKSFKQIGQWMSFRTPEPNINGKYIRTNDFGLLSARYPLAQMGLKALENKKNGIKNVVLIGGSSAAGQGATNNDTTIVSYLNQMLGDKGYEVFSLAMYGYTSYLELAMYASIGIYLEPDIVVVMNGYNDAFRYTFGKNYSYENLSRGIWTEVKDGLDPVFVLTNYYKNLEAICLLSQTAGTRVFLSVQPIAGLENDTYMGVDSIRNTWKVWPELVEVAKAVGNRNNAEYLDLIRVFKGEKGSQLNFYDNLHFTSTGQEKVARAISNAVLSPRRSKTSDQVGTAFEERFEIVNQILKKDYSQLYETADNMGFKTLLKAEAPDIPLVVFSEKQPAPRAESLVIDGEKVVAFRSPEKKYYFKGALGKLKPGKYLVKVRLAYSNKKKDSLEIMVGDWVKGKVFMGERLAASPNGGKPSLQSLQYRFRLEEPRDGLELRISNLGGTEIYLNSYSLEFSG